MSGPAESRVAFCLIGGLFGMAHGCLPMFFITLASAPPNVWKIVITVAVLLPPTITGAMYGWRNADSL